MDQHPDARKRQKLKHSIHSWLFFCFLLFSQFSRHTLGTRSYSLLWRGRRAIVCPGGCEGDSCRPAFAPPKVAGSGRGRAPRAAVRAGRQRAKSKQGRMATGPAETLRTAWLQGSRSAAGSLR